MQWVNHAQQSRMMEALPVMLEMQLRIPQKTSEPTQQPHSQVVQIQQTSKTGMNLLWTKITTSR